MACIYTFFCKYIVHVFKEKYKKEKMYVKIIIVCTVIFNVYKDFYILLINKAKKTMCIPIKRGNKNIILKMDNTLKILSFLYSLFATFGVIYTYYDCNRMC